MNARVREFTAWLARFRGEVRMSLSLFSRSHLRRLQDALMAHADALLAGETARPRALSGEADVELSELESLFDIAEHLHQTLRAVEPPEHFVEDLRQQLMAAEDVVAPTLWGRIRHLPPRTQLAAGIGGATLTAGVVILATRSFGDVWGNWRSRRTATA